MAETAQEAETDKKADPGFLTKLKERLAKKNITAAQLPATFKAFDRILPILESVMDAPPPPKDDNPQLQERRNVRNLVNEIYPGLSVFEAIGAIRKMAASATIVTEESAPELRALYDEMYEDYRRKAVEKNETPIAKPKLILLESDMVGASGGLTRGQPDGTIFITTRSTEVLNRDQQKAILAHELGHVALHFKPSIVPPLIKRHIMKVITRGANTRRQEFEADAFAVDVTGDPETLISALESAIEDSKRLKEVGLHVSNEMRGIMREMAEDIPSRCVRWVISRAIKEKTPKEIEEEAAREESPGFIKKLIKAPTHPTQDERSERIRTRKNEEGAFRG